LIFNGLFCFQTFQMVFFHQFFHQIDDFYRIIET